MGITIFIILALSVLVPSGVGSVSAQTSALQIADSDLEERVRATLAALPVLSVERDEIRVNVRDGAVTLRGCVETQAEKEEIDLRVKLITGVESLNNALTIGCPQEPDLPQQSP